MKGVVLIMSIKTSNNTSGFTPEEQARIDAEVKAAQEKARQAEIDAAVRNKILDEQRLQPGYTGY